MDLALEKGELDALTADVRKTHTIISGHSELLRLLRSPIIHPAKKMPILDLVFSGRIHPILMNFIEILVRKHREEHLLEIIKVYLQRYNDYKNIKSVRITTAVAIDPALQQAVAESLRESKDSTIELETSVDPDLIGGYVIRYGDKQYDASILRNLTRLRKEFDQNTYVKRY